ncbi:hypothetical protein [Nocardia nepalensis]
MRQRAAQRRTAAFGENLNDVVDMADRQMQAAPNRSVRRESQL